MALQTWELWYPEAGATGLPFVRARIDATQSVLVHAAPPTLAVWVRDESDQVLVRDAQVAKTADTPITRLTLQGSQVIREDIWPDTADLGMVVLLPGGEAGVLKAWWHAPDHSEWRWQAEFYNHR